MLRAGDVPDSVLPTVRDTISTVDAGPGFGTPGLSRARLEDLNLTLPHAIYVLGLDDLVNERTLRAARQVGWRYLVESGERVIASAELLIEADGQVARVSQFNEGPFVGGTADKLAELEEHPELQGDTYELRLLQIPGVYAVALWLAHDDESLSRLSVLSPAPPQLDVAELYVEEAFLARLVEPAQRNLEFYSGLR